MVVIAGELIVRFGSFGPDVFSLQRGMIRISDHPSLRYELVPHYVSPRRDITINRHGMRHPPVETAKNEDSFRVALIGDSIAFGMGAGQEEHLAIAIMREAAARPFATRIEALNFGVPGYNIEQVATSLETKVAPFEPDHILYIYCLNDPQEFSRELEVLLRQSEISSAERDYLHRLWQASTSPLGGSKLWMLIRYRIASWRTSATPEPSPIIDDMHRILHGEAESYYHTLYRRATAISRLEQGLDDLATWSRDHQTPVSLVIVPLFIELDAYPFLALHEIVTTMAAERNLTVLDLLSAFQDLGKGGWKEVHADPIHPNRKGYALIAKHLVDWITTEIIQP